MVDRQADVSYGVELRDGRDRQHIKLTYVIHYYFNQENSVRTLTDLLEAYSGYPSDLLETIEFVVVDDCSSIQIDLTRFRLNLRHLRIQTDIPWNQGGARNLAGMVGAGPWLLLSDIDIFFPEKTLRHIANKRMVGSRFYKFWRWNEVKSCFHKPHSNVFLISRGTFLNFWGYDEEYAGGHGGEDYRFVKFLKSQGMIQLKLPKRYFAINRTDLDRETGYHNLSRDQSRNAPIDARKRSEMKYLGRQYGHSRIFLDFEWVTLSTTYLRSKNLPRKDMLWKRLWLVRQFISLLSIR